MRTRVFLAVSGIALIIRVIYLLQAQANDPLFFAPQMDALYHHQWAMALANGVNFITDAYFRAPLYPFILGLCYKVFGINLLAARLFQAVIGSISCSLLYLLSRRLFNEPVARLSGIVMALYPLAIYFDGELLIANLLIFLTLLGMVLLYRSWHLDKQWYLPGLAFGLAAIARPNVLVPIVALLGWFFWEYRLRPGKLSRALQFAAAVALVIAPVTIRNYAVSGRFVLIAWQGGTNFYIGNNPESDGITAIVPGTRKDWWGGYYDVRRLAEQALGRELKGAEIDGYWFRQGLRYWQTQPLAALGKLLRKSYLWLSGYEVSNNRDTYFFSRYTFLRYLIHNTPLLKFPFGLLLPLALVGSYLSRQRWRQLLPVYLFMFALMASFVIFFVTDRYRMPFVILTIPLAVSIVSRIRHASPRERVIAAVIFVLSFLLFNLNLARIPETDSAQNYFLVAKAQHDLATERRDPQLLARAVTNLEQALARDSAVNILSLEATIRTELGQTSRAEQAAAAAIRLWPEVADAWGLAGNVAAQQGNLDRARACFERALELDPYSLQALNNLGLVAMDQNDYSRARNYLERALAIDPTYTLALFHLGLLNYYEGRKEAAHTLWRRVLQIDPTHQKAAQALQQLR